MYHLLLSVRQAHILPQLEKQSRGIKVLATGLYAHIYKLKCRLQRNKNQHGQSGRVVMTLNAG